MICWLDWVQILTLLADEDYCIAVCTGTSVKPKLPAFLFGLLLVQLPAHSQTYIGSQVCEYTAPRARSYRFPCSVKAGSSSRIAKIINTKNGDVYTVYKPGSQESGRQGAWVNHPDFSNCITMNDGYPPKSDDPQICTVWTGQRGDG